MISYEQLKTWLGEKENKDKMVLGACFIFVFLVGFGTGSFNKSSRPSGSKTQYNYTTSQTKAPAAKPAAAVPAVPKQSIPAATTTPSAQSCAVKGNSSSKIYHVAGDAFYKTLKSPQCFATEAEAVAAGYVKSKR